MTPSLDWRGSLMYVALPLLLAILSVRAGRGWVGVALATVAFTMVCQYGLYLGSLPAVTQNAQYGWLYVIANRLPWVAVVVAAMVMRAEGTREMFVGGLSAALAVVAGMVLAGVAQHVLGLVKLKLY